MDGWRKDWHWNWKLDGPDCISQWDDGRDRDREVIMIRWFYQGTKDWGLVLTFNRWFGLWRWFKGIVEFLIIFWREVRGGTHWLLPFVTKYEEFSKAAKYGDGDIGGYWRIS
jgi:hypothetical protein